MIKIYLRKFLTSIVSTIWSKLIVINLFLLNKFSKKKYFYNNSGGFGDTYTFFLETFFLINKNKNFIPLTYSNYQKTIIEFLFSKNKNILFSIPKFIPIYQTISKIKKSKFFKPYNNVSFYSAGTQDLKILNNNLTKNLLERKLLKSKISKKVLFLRKEKYICLHVKHYNNNINDLSGSNARQTTNFEKIFLLINFFLKHKIKILILGNKHDKFIPIIKKQKFTNHLNTIFYFQDLTDEYSFADQVFVTKHSKGYVGSGAGMADLFYFLKKKSICFDTYYDKKIENIFKKKYRKFLYKKIKIRNHVNILKESSLTLKAKYKIYETSKNQLLKAVKNFFI
jgi:hypothetical protein